MSGGAWMVLLVNHIAARDPRKNVIHATPWREVLDAQRAKRKTVPTVCGRSRRDYPYAVHAVSPEGCSRGAMVLSWPPRLKAVPEGFVRCVECYVLTGKPRPDRQWDDLKPGGDTEPEPCEETA